MDLHLRSELIRAEREKRAWTQEHVAELAGLGVRTIQRVEATGTASPESATALSAALEIPLSELRAGASVGDRSSDRKPIVLDAFALATAAFASLLFTPPNLIAQIPILFMISAYFFGRRRASMRRPPP